MKHTDSTLTKLGGKILKEFNKIAPQSLNESPFKLIGTDWMLITAGDKENFNMMTAAWGGFGYLWNRNICIIYVRPQRYTYQFTEENEYFTLTFFAEKYKDALNYCGTHSGRNVDKTAETGLTPRETELGNIYFDEARIVIECRKIYYQDIVEDCFVDSDIDEEVYPKKDYHRMYIGEVKKILVEA
jgi:flavin reductase (DIM6/NTAB) family NADH-FMN oxidoreductase RutF